MNPPEQRRPPPRRDALQRGPAVVSPCVNVCRMNAAAGLCEGCLRTLSEITAWGSMPEAEKEKLWEQLRRRRAVLEGGMAAITTEGGARAQAGPGGPDRGPLR